MSELLQILEEQETEKGQDLPAFRSVNVRRPTFGRTSRGNEWSSADLQLLRELAAAGTPADTIATTLRRTASAIRNKAGMHGISLKGGR